MLEEFRIAYVRHRESDLSASSHTAWNWLDNAYALVPEARADRVRWSYEHADSPWHVAFTPGIHAIDVDVDDEPVLRDGVTA